MQIVQSGADFSGAKVLNRVPQTGDLMMIADLTGGVEDVARAPLYGEVEELSKSGSPTFKRQGVLLDASNYLGTSLDPDNFDESNLTLAGVFFRDPTTMYLGNFDNGATCDALLESTGLVTRFRYRSSGVNTNVDPPNPCPIGAPFFFAASCTTAGVTAVIGYLGRIYTATSAAARDVGGTLPYRIGMGPGTSFTNSAFLACGAAMWNRALTVGDLAEVYAWFRARHELVGVNY